MAFRPKTSRSRFQQYRRDLAAHRTEGSRRTAQAHAKNRSGRGKGNRTFTDLLAAFIGMLRGHRKTVAIAMVMLSVSTVLGLIPPYAIKIVIDNVLGANELSLPLAQRITLPDDPRLLLSIIAIAIIAISIAALILGMWSRWQATRITKRLQSGIRKRVFEHAVRLPLHRIQALRSGGVASILREDAGGVAELIFGMLYNPWKAIITLLGALIILAAVDWKLLLGSLILIPIVYVTHRTWIAKIRPMYRDIRATRTDIDSHATEAFGGMRVVRGFGRQQSEANRFTRNNHFMIRQEILAWWWARGIDIAWAVLIPLASAALLWYGGLRVLSGALTIGELVMFLAYLAMLLNPLATLAASATQFQNSLAALDRVLDLMDEPIEMPAQAGAITLDRSQVQGRIEFRGVNFTYPGSNERILNNINLDVAPGEMIALVGPSGSGKTTLCNLLARFYDPNIQHASRGTRTREQEEKSNDSARPKVSATESTGQSLDVRSESSLENGAGAIFLDDMDLREIDVDSYRRLLGIVEQDIFLFDGTIGENIGYGRRDATEEDIIEAARLANAHEFISKMERGYNTLIGERGVRLSGGQRQRLAIARAILADPRILILDEATSSLDTESERLIQKSLAHLMRGRTSFVIAHRLSTITHADRIVVLDGGRIVEEGTHAELMSRSGRYRKMVRLQIAPTRTAREAVRDADDNGEFDDEADDLFADEAIEI